LSREQADRQRLNVILVAGLAGSGKTETGKILAGLTGWALLDKDTLTRPLVESLLMYLNGDPNDRHTSQYLEQVRPREYDCLMKTAWENVTCGVSTILSAPFLREVNDADWLRRIVRRCHRFNAKMHIVWVASDAASMRSRLISRAAGRDIWKLANWDTYLRAVDPEMLPEHPHFLIDNRECAVVPLADQVARMAQAMSDDELRGVILYGPPGAGKDTVSRALSDLDSRFRPVVKVKVGSGNTQGYRMSSELELSRLRAEGRVVQENERYGNVYAVDRADINQLWNSRQIPILHTGRLNDLRTLRGALPGNWVVVMLWCDRDTASRRFRDRRDPDHELRLKVWDETAAELAESGDGELFAVVVRTDRTPAVDAAELIRSVLLDGSSDTSAHQLLAEIRQ